MKVVLFSFELVRMIRAFKCIYQSQKKFCVRAFINDTIFIYRQMNIFQNDMCFSIHFLVSGFSTSTVQYFEVSIPPSIDSI
jgi:hypothetical protein